MSTAVSDPHKTLLSNAPVTIRWHKPLLVVAGLMALIAAYALVARFLNPVEVTGLNQWDKPLKFALSFVIYCVTWSWLIGQLQRGRMLASIAGISIGLTSIVEMIIITGAAATGTTSHFNVSTPFTTKLWVVMSIAITILWLSNLVVAIMLFVNRLGDPARTIAIRAGVVLSLVGLALGFLMTGPTAEQLDNFQGIAGAHTVGLEDGGPGLPILGWSTVAGDLRIPHFIGMHALQAIPLALIAIELLSRRIPILRSFRLRALLISVVTAGYIGFMALLTAQAISGQSIVQPDAATVLAAISIVAACGLIAVAAISREVRRTRL
jgi:hypothetical protein